MGDFSVGPKDSLTRLIELSMDLKEVTDGGEGKKKEYSDIFLRSVSQGEKSFVLREKGWFSRFCDRIASSFSLGKKKITPYDLKSNLEAINNLLEKAKEAENTTKPDAELNVKFYKSFKGDVGKAIDTLFSYINQINVNEDLKGTKLKVTTAALALLNQIKASKKQEIEGSFNELLEKLDAQIKPLLTPETPQKITDRLDGLKNALTSAETLKRSTENACSTAGIGNIAGIAELETKISKLKQLELATNVRKEFCTYPGSDSQTIPSTIDTLNNMKNVAEKLFLLIPHNDNPTVFNLYHLEGGNVFSGTLTITDDGKYEVIFPHHHKESFNTLEELQVKLGDFAIEAKKKAKMKELDEISKGNIYDNREEAEKALNDTMSSDVAKTLNTHVYWKDENEKTHILTHRAGSENYTDYEIDFEKEPGKIMLKNAGGFFVRDFGESGVRRDLGEPLNQLNANLTLYTKNQELYNEFQNDIYTYNQLRDQGVEVASNAFTDLNIDLKARFEETGIDKNQFLLVADDNEPTKASFTLIRYIPEEKGTLKSMYKTVPSKIIMDKVSVAEDGKVTLQPIDLNGQEQGKKLVLTDLKELKTHLNGNESLKINIQTKLNILETKLEDCNQQFKVIRETILKNCPPNEPTYNVDQLVKELNKLNSLRKEIKENIRKSGVTLKDPVILQQINKEINTIEFRLRIADASEIFVKSVKAAKQYSDLDSAHADMQTVLAQCTNSEYDMTIGEILHLSVYHSTIDSHRRTELFPQYFDQDIPELQKKWLATFQDLSDLSKIKEAELEVQCTLNIVQAYQNTKPVGTSTEKLEQTKTSLESIKDTLKEAEKSILAKGPPAAVAHGGSGQGSGMVMGNGNNITIINGTPGAHQAEVAESISAVSTSVLSQEYLQAVALGVLTLIGGGVALPLVAGVALTAVALPVGMNIAAKKYLPERVASCVQQFIPIGTALFYQLYVVPKVLKYSSTPAAIPTAAAPQDKSPAGKSKPPSPKEETVKAPNYKKLEPLESDLISFSSSTQAYNLTGIPDPIVDIDVPPLHPSVQLTGTSPSSQPITPIYGQFVAEVPVVDVVKAADSSWGINLFESLPSMTSVEKAVNTASGAAVTVSATVSALVALGILAPATVAAAPAIGTFAAAAGVLSSLTTTVNAMRIPVTDTTTVTTVLSGQNNPTAPTTTQQPSAGTSFDARQHIIPKPGKTNVAGLSRLLQQKPK